MKSCRVRPIKIIISFSLAVLLVITTTNIVYAAEAPSVETTEQTTELLSEERLGEEAEREVIQLKTAEDLMKLSAGSTNDAYSRGKIFRLENDIDLSHTDFRPISIFAGVFEGNGKRITGFEIRQSGADLGFFRFVEEGAVVRNLTISGDIRPEGIMERIGGITGTNRGRIENCVFEGFLLTKQISGGIAGYNEETGIITGCTNKGELVGIKQIGGIVGKNEGYVLQCTNQGNVNSSSQTAHDLLDEDSSVSMSLDDGLSRDSLVDENKITFIGGIAGASAGTVDSCINRGKVGYQHTGYKVGGIVGYQQGNLTGSRNYGTVTGRRDVGGIAGQFEPYIEVVYEADTSDKLRAQGDDMESLMDGLADISDRASETNNANFDALEEERTQLTDAMEEYKDYYKDKGDNFHDEMESRLSSIEDTLDDLGIDAGYGDIRGPMQTIRNDVDRIKELLGQLAQPPGTRPATPTSLGDSHGTPIKDIGDDINDYMERAKAIFAEIGALNDDIDRQIDAIQRAMGNLGDEFDDFRDDLDRLERKLKSLRDYTKDTLSSFRDDLDHTSTDLSDKRDTVSDQLEVIRDDMKATNDEVTDQLELIKDQLRLMSDTTADGMDALRDKLDFDPKEDDWYTDISDQEGAESDKGMLVRCINDGEVISDISGGGIVGSMALERDADTDFSIKSIGDKTMKYEYYARATILDCENLAPVTVKNNYAGGIAGRSDVGAILHSNNYGLVESTDGDYAGGIAGRSEYLVRNCYVLSEISGNSYVGGVIGYGKNADSNYAMVDILSETGEKNGSIMGDVNDDAIVFDNCYVDEGIAAINNLTYERAAKGISYENLVEMEETPSRFSSFTVRFIADGNLVKSMTCQYGQAITSSQIPPVPDRDGKTGIWETRDLSFINRNIIIHALYNDWTTTIASGEQIPVILASGMFYDDTTLQYTDIQPEEIPNIDRYRPVSAYHVTMDSKHGIPDEKMGVRLLAEDSKSRTVLLWSEEEQHIVEAQRDGKYLVLPVSGVSNFAILERNSTPIWLICVGVCVLLITVCVLWVYRYKKLKSGVGKKRSDRVNGSDSGGMGNGH